MNYSGKCFWSPFFKYPLNFELAKILAVIRYWVVSICRPAAVFCFRPRQNFVYYFLCKEDLPCFNELMFLKTLFLWLGALLLSPGSPQVCLSENITFTCKGNASKSPLHISFQHNSEFVNESDIDRISDTEAKFTIYNVSEKHSNANIVCLNGTGSARPPEQWSIMRVYSKS